MEAAKAGLQGMTVRDGGAETTGVPGHWRVLIFGQNPNRTLCRVLIWGVVVIAFFHHLLVPIQIVGSSMWPTYHNGSLNFVNRWSYTGTAPTHGDVVALEADGELLLKRIVAGPGDTVAIVNGQLQINERTLADPFARFKIPWEMDPMTLGSDEYFVIGDNRSASIFCTVEKKHILGKILF